MERKYVIDSTGWTYKILKEHADGSVSVSSVGMQFLFYCKIRKGDTMYRVAKECISPCDKIMTFK